MSTFPKVDTVQNNLKNITYNGNKLTDKQITTLLKLKYKDDLLLTLKDRNFILEVVGLLNTIGFDKTVTHLKANTKESYRFNIIKNSEPFTGEKQRFFLETTRDIRTVKMESNIKCKRCKEYQIETVTKQVRSADEGETTFYKCRNCGFGWQD